MVAEAQRSMLSGMFSFMKKTSRVRHNPESEGIYLSDLNADELDPEVAALYFPSSHRGTTVAKGIPFIAYTLHYYVLLSFFYCLFIIFFFYFNYIHRNSLHNLLTCGDS